MLISDWCQMMARIEYTLEIVLDGIELREGISFKEPKHDIAKWITTFLPQFGDLEVKDE